MLQLIFSLLLLSQVLAAPSSVRLERKGLQWDYQNDKIKGVNLGGWFVLEPYITPSLFDIWSNGLDDSNTPVDEYHYCQKLGKEVALLRLEQHWSSFYTEADFEQIASLGLNTVRIPIGYWAFQLLDNDPYVQGQVQYLDQALEWSRNYGLKVWVDLHGAPGSQNGFDNSGSRDTLDFQKGNNVQTTLDVLKTIGAKYGGSAYEDVVIGIELLNEPLGPALDINQLKDFFYKGYETIRTGNEEKSYNAIIVHDAFEQSPHYWDNDFLVDNGYWNVVIDHHHYQVFDSAQLQYSIDEHISQVCTWGSEHKDESHWNVIGEWSAALTDCAKWLNGVGRGARWSGDYDSSPFIGSCAPYTSINNWTDDHKKNVRRYVEAQLDAWEQVGGWIFWCWKTEDAVDWDFQRLNDGGVFPSPLNDRQYPNQCNY